MILWGPIGLDISSGQLLVASEAPKATVPIFGDWLIKH